jgi:SAM-dependent methyltransferase
MIQAFYDQLAPFYHLLFEDWDASMARQAAVLDSLIRARWPGRRPVTVDLAAGIGTQAIGLAGLGYSLTASDLSRRAVLRARQEAERRLVRFPVAVADFQSLPYRDGAFDLAIAADNALPHLLSDTALRTAIRECYRCLRPAGGLLFSVRDYGPPPPMGTVEHHPYGWRRWGEQRYYVDQEWRWDGACYDFRITASRSPGDEPSYSFAGRYYAVPVVTLQSLCRAAGFVQVERMDGEYYQPVIVAT